MFDFIQQFYPPLKGFLEPTLENFDPSLLQNVIISILAIFIPFVIVFLTTVLDPAKQRNNLAKKVLINEIFSPKKIFWLSVVGVILFSLYTGKDVDIEQKIFAIILVIIVVAIFLSSFKKMLKFSEGNTTEFEFSFLKKLKFSKIFKTRNKQKGQKMIDAWNSFLSEKNIFDERRFIDVYISRINDAFRLKMFDTGIKLSEVLLNNIENRDYFIIYNEILTNILRWDELLWNEQQNWLKHYDKRQRLEIFFEKYIPTFKKIYFSLYKNKRSDNFWQWNFFHNRFLTKITDLMLTTGQEAFPFFDCLKLHINQSEDKLNLIVDQDIKNKYFSYITNVVSKFAQIFYDKIDLADSQFSIWENYFPSEWKITTNNSKNNISRIFLNEFLKWSRERIIRDNKQEFDNSLSNVIHGLFPNVDNSYFSVFILWYFLYDLKNTLIKDVNFYILSVSVSWVGEMDDKQIDEVLKEKENSKKEETIKIIIDYFSSHWSVMKFYETDLSEDEKNNWDNLTMDNKKGIIKKIRIKNLEKYKSELENAEIVNMCNKDANYENRRKSLVELIKSLIISI